MCFKHFVFLIVAILHWIPDCPKFIDDQIERNNLVVQKVLWQMKPENNSSTAQEKKDIDELNIET